MQSACNSVARSAVILVRTAERRQAIAKTQMNRMIAPTMIDSAESDRKPTRISESSETGISRMEAKVGPLMKSRMLSNDRRRAA